MIIGVPKEIKEHEYRVSMTPDGVRGIIKNGHRILLEKSAGAGSGFSDEEYLDAGALLCDKYRVYHESDLIIKVKEPLPSEFGLLRERHSIFTFLHLAPNAELIKVLLEKKITALAYETLKVDGSLPLLMPMSEIAGRMAPLMAAYYQQKFYGGRGILLPGAEGVLPANVVILGAGTVGMNALKVVFGMGADITVLNKGLDKLVIIEKMYNGKVKTLPATADNIESGVLQADIVIGAVSIPGARAPRLVSEPLVSGMKKGSVVVDVAVDQGGCIETTRPTTHSNPIYIVNDVVHYAVANMPGAYPRTSTIALTKSTLPYIKMLADKGIEKALEESRPLKSALNIYNGSIVHEALADSLARK